MIFADEKLIAVVPDDFRTKERIVWRQNGSRKQKRAPSIDSLFFTFPPSPFILNCRIFLTLLNMV